MSTSDYRLRRHLDRYDHRAVLGQMSHDRLARSRDKFELTKPDTHDLGLRGNEERKSA